MNAIILCGGLSTRLGEITKDVPKILLPVGEKRVIDWQLEHLQVLGVTQTVLAAGHLAHVLRNTMGATYGDMELLYAIEDKKLGTGGAIKHALSYVDRPNAPTVVLNGDILTACRLADMCARLQHDSDGIMLAARVDDVAEYGTLAHDVDQRLIAFKEKEGIHKPGYINGGVYVFTPRVHQYFPPADTFSIEYDVFPRMTGMYVHESEAPWVDVGVPERLAWAREHWQLFAQQ